MFRIEKMYKIKVGNSEVVLTEDELKKVYSAIGEMIGKTVKVEKPDGTFIAETPRKSKIYKVKDKFIIENRKGNIKRATEKYINNLLSKALEKLKDAKTPLSMTEIFGGRISGSSYPIVRYLLESRNDILKVGRKFMLKPEPQPETQPTPQTNSTFF